MNFAAVAAIDKHTLALISIIGSAFDVLGALYLAYDLLGGEHGPLRERGGFDQVLQSLTGVAVFQGGGIDKPQLVLGSVLDYFTSALLAYGVAAALFRRERSGGGVQSGQGLKQVPQLLVEVCAADCRKAEEVLPLADPDDDADPGSEAGDHRIGNEPQYAGEICRAKQDQDRGSDDLRRNDAERRELPLYGHDRTDYCAQFRLSLLKRTFGRRRYYPRPFDNVKLGSKY